MLRKQMEKEDRKEESPPARSLKEFDDFQPVPANPPVIIRAPQTGEAVFASLSIIIPLPSAKDIDHPPEVSFL
ncbi:MAG TPA: hypothetical protein VL126_01780 [Bacteroidota bacterium]|nr:hypothetical protein [Bacteroidota bacterium]